MKDAHDRYANIEVAYLLQKMEDHDGVVILASNLTKNLDDAFARRMHYVVEFPLPNAVHREQLWRGMFPPQAPVADDVDFKFLSEQFPSQAGISGTWFSRPRFWRPNATARSACVTWCRHLAG